MSTFSIALFNYDLSKNKFKRVFKTQIIKIITFIISSVRRLGVNKHYIK